MTYLGTNRSTHRHIRRARAVITALALVWLFMCAVASPASARTTQDEHLRASLITCWPGSEVYELCGHEALRIQDEYTDSVWNYGVFDFHEPNFIYRFVKGETDYLLAGYPFAWFMPEYIGQRRRVVEQELNLTPEEVGRLRSMLQEEALPENRRYRYNYVKDNCATRILDRIDSVAGGPVIYTDSISYGTFRTEMRHYHKNYPWYQFGIDLALGSGLDYTLKGKEEMFVPMEMMRKASTARLPDGRPLIHATRVLNEGSEDATLGPTSPLLTPLAATIALAAVSLFVAIIDCIRRNVTRWFYSLFYLIIGAIGCVSFFLVFFSSHEATSPNILVLWLNPLQLIAAVCLWWRVTRPAALAVAYYDIVAVSCMLIVWPFQHQVANPAIFPLAAATVVLSISYAINSRRNSYKFTGQLPSSAPRRGRKGKSGRRTK